MKTTTKRPHRVAPAVDHNLLDEYHKRCTAVCDCVFHVIHNEDVNGFYLWGPRGCGKTTGIKRGLEKIGKQPLIFKGTSTAEGLFKKAKQSPDSVLWFMDDPRLLADRAAQQYLLAMLEPEAGEEKRIITKVRQRDSDSDQFEFRGKLLFDSNVHVGHKPVLQAVEDRLMVHHFAPPDPELAAVMMYLALLEDLDPDDNYPLIRLGRERKYWKRTTPDERMTIAAFIVTESTTYNHPLSLRLFIEIIRYYVDQRDHGLQTDWRDMVMKKITQHDVRYAHTKLASRKKDRLEKEREELQILLEDHEEMGGTTEKRDIQELWMELTGKNQRQFFRRLGELPENMRELYESFPDGRGPR